MAASIKSLARVQCPAHSFAILRVMQSARRTEGSTITMARDQMAKRFGAIMSGCMLAATLTGAQPAHAHPHVFVAVETEVVYNDGGEISGLKHRWHFDELYSMFAVEGLDTNGDGAYSEAELAGLVKENVEGLKEYDYFTFAEIEGTKVEFAEPPPDYKMERDAKGILTINFFLPLKAPVKPGTLKFSFEVYDPEYYIAFAFAPENSVRLAATAPKGCSVTVSGAPSATDASEDPNASWGSANAGKAVVSCSG